MSNIAKIKTLDIANGEGIRTSIFFSGCSHCCPGCFNQELWDYDYGVPCDDEVYKEIYDSMNEHVAGISILGGEPFDPKNIDDLLSLVARFKRDFPDKTVWIWSGYTWEELRNRTEPINEFGQVYLDVITGAILSVVDVLVDGRFVLEQRDLNLRWKGSKNQRAISVQESLKKREIVLYE